MGQWWRWELVSPDGVAPSRMVSVSASVNLPLHHKVEKFSSGTGCGGGNNGLYLLPSHAKSHMNAMNIAYNQQQAAIQDSTE